MIVLVDDCRKCPFANVDNETGYDMCNLHEFLHDSPIFENQKITDWEQLPDGSVHELCPLRTNKHFSFEVIE